MDNDDNIDAEVYRKKETYTDEEKRIIMERLDRERRITQQALKGIDGKKAHYTQSEKQQILNRLNEERLTKQKREENIKNRTHNKETYIFHAKTFYKLANIEQEYYVLKEDCEKLSSRPTIVSLYYKTFGALKKKDVLMKVEPYSDKFFISYDAIRTLFETYSLEDARKK